MGVIINIDEALKNRTDYNVLGEPLNAMIKNQQEAWERENPIDMIYVRNSIDKFQETYTSSIGFDKAFVDTNDYAIGPIFNTAEGFSATYRTRTFQGSFIITQQTLEDRQYGTAKDTANSFVKRWHGDIVEYAMAALGAGHGVEVVWGGDGKDGKSRLKLNSADTTDGDITGTKNPLFYNKHTIVKRDGMSAADITAAYQSNNFYANIDYKGEDPARIAKLADVINQVITIMENYRDDNGKRAGVLGAKTIVAGNDAHLKAALETAVSTDMFMQGETKFPNPAKSRATVKTSPYYLDIDMCKDGNGFFIVDKAYNEENHGLELTERIPFTLDAFEKREAPRGIKYEGRQRFDINCASWRGIAYVRLGTPGNNSGWDKVGNYTRITPTSTIVKPVSIVGTVSTKAST